MNRYFQITATASVEGAGGHYLTTVLRIATARQSVDVGFAKQTLTLTDAPTALPAGDAPLPEARLTVINTGTENANIVMVAGGNQLTFAVPPDDGLYVRLPADVTAISARADTGKTGEIEYLIVK